MKKVTRGSLYSRYDALPGWPTKNSGVGRSPPIPIGEIVVEVDGTSDMTAPLCISSVVEDSDVNWFSQ
jgi:hypothetical protein